MDHILGSMFEIFLLFLDLDLFKLCKQKNLNLTRNDPRGIYFQNWAHITKNLGNIFAHFFLKLDRMQP